MNYPNYFLYTISFVPHNQINRHYYFHSTHFHGSENQDSESLNAFHKAINITNGEVVRTQQPDREDRNLNTNAYNKITAS